MNKLSYLTMFAAVLTAMTLASCGDDDAYTPGAAVSENSPSVYFSNESESSVFLDPDVVSANPDSVWEAAVTVKRPDGTGVLTVPIIVDTKSEGVDVPESVTFKDGETSTDVIIQYVHPDNGLDVTFHLDESYTNPYKVVDGTTNFKLSIVILEKLCDVTYSTSSTLTGKNLSHFAGVTSEIWSCKGRNKFMWKDFMGSGINVFFSVKPAEGVTFNPSNISALNGEILLLDHKLDYYGYGYYFIMTDDNEWPSWVPEGQTDTIEYFYMYEGSYAYSGYSFIDFAPRTDGYYSGYFYGGFQINGTGAWTVDGTGYIYYFFHYDD